MDPVLTIAISGLQAARKRLEVSASNIANAGTTGGLPDAGPFAPAAYTPLRVEQQTTTGGGVTAKAVPLENGTVAEYAPDRPYANKQGLVAAPQVDLATEGVSQLSAVRAYQASAQLVRVAGDLQKRLLESLGGTKA